MAYTTINKSSSFQNQVLYTGNGSTQSVTGVGFQPDWTWCKQRNTARNHGLFDAVRGVTKILYSNDASGQGTAATSLTSFNSDGFSCGGETETNQNGGTYVSWNWKAGTAVSGNTSGSGTYKTYTGSVNTTSGFSIIKYVGNGTAGHTIPHHLGTANIGSIFVKNLDSGSDYWYSYHKPLGATKTLILNETDAAGTNTMWNNTAPTSSVFSVGALSGSNSNNANYIAYIFTDTTGYCKTGSYIGNGNDDGAFVYTGFKPAFVMVKITAGQTDNWIMQDNKINSFNGASSQRLRPNSSGAEFSSSNEIDLLSNGFKTHGADGEINGSGFSYIYMAFGQSLVGTNNIPNNAR